LKKMITTIILMAFASALILMIPNQVSVRAQAQDPSTMSIINPGPASAPDEWNATPRPGEIGGSSFTFYGPQTPVNSTFFVNVTIANAIAMRGWQIGLVYDNTTLAYVSAWLPTDHVFSVPQANGTWVFVFTKTVSDFDTTHKEVLCVSSYQVQDPPWDWTFNGTGVACQIQFKLVKPVNWTTMWTNVLYFDPEWTKISRYDLPSPGIEFPNVAAGYVNYFYETAPPQIDTPIQTPTSVPPNTAVLVSVNVTDPISGVKSVTLNYTTDNGNTWTSLTMTMNPTSGRYEASIPGEAAGTSVKYKIDASNYAGNSGTNNNAGSYFPYVVVPEFPATTTMLLVFAIASLTAVIARKHNKRPVLRV
jgi:hypothetical protein